MIILRARVIKEWRIHENGKLEKNIIIKAFLAYKTEKETDLSKGKRQTHTTCLETMYGMVTMIFQTI